MKFTAYNAVTGEVLYSGTADNINVLASDDTAILEGEVFSGGWIAEGQHFAMPEQPSPFHAFDWTTKEWVLQADERLEQTRAQTKQAWNQWRDTKLRSGFQHNGHTFHSDDTFLGELQLLLKGYERGHLTGTSAIRTKENAVIQMNEQEIETLLLMIGLYRQSIYAQSWAGKDALNDPALTYEQLLEMGPPTV